MKKYGQVTLEDMHDKEQELISMHYDPTKPVDTVFSTTNQFRDLCILTEQPKSDNQLTNISYIIFNKLRIFMDSLKMWNKSTPVEKTYAAFKTYLRKEYNELRKVGALTIQQSHLHPQANLAVDTSQTLTEQISSTVANDIRTTIMDAIMALNQPEQPSVPVVPQANAATTDPNVSHLTQMVAALQQQINQMSGQLSAPPVPSLSTNPRTGKQWK